MYGRQELVELGERVAEDGVHRHERSLQELALAVETRSPGAAAVLSDPTAPDGAAANARSPSPPTSCCARRRGPRSPRIPTDIGDELQRVLRDWQGQLVAWGA